MTVVPHTQEIMRKSTYHPQKQPPTDMNFPGESIYVLRTVEQTEIFQDSRRAYRKDMFFQGDLFVEQTLNYLIEQIVYSFSRKPYLVLEHTYDFPGDPI